MAKFFICRRVNSIYEGDKWIEEAMKNLRKERLGKPIVKHLKPKPESDDSREHQYVFGLYYECSDSKEKKLMDKYGWRIGQTVNGIDFMESI